MSAELRGENQVGARVAQVGTFDVENLGDLLFPLLASDALGRRIDDLELVAYAAHAPTQPGWPYEVRSLDRLIDEISDFDLLLVGGGEFIHFYPGFIGPDDPRLHDPTSLWMGATLLAAAHDVPVAWNAVGVGWNFLGVDGFPEWGRLPTAAALRATTYAAVRDARSAEWLGELAPQHPIEIVPDTAFGIRNLVPAERSERCLALLDELGVDRPYAVVQPSEGLKPFEARVARRVQQLRERGFAILELPIGPFQGDRPGVLELPEPVSRPRDWPDPMLIAELIAGAEGVIAISLHLSIVAAAFGVPVTRVPLVPTKFEILEQLPGVQWWERDSDPNPGPVPRREPGTPPVITEMEGRLDRHWDRVVSCIGTTGSGVAALSELALAVPGVLESLESRAAAAERDSASRQERIEQLQQAMAGITASPSWRVTAPLRAAKRRILGRGA